MQNDKIKNIRLKLSKNCKLSHALYKIRINVK